MPPRLHASWLPRVTTSGAAASYPQQCLGYAYTMLLRWEAAERSFLAAREGELDAAASRITDFEAQVAALLSGDVDMLTDLPTQDVARLRADIGEAWMLPQTYSIIKAQALTFHHFCVDVGNRGCGQLAVQQGWAHWFSS